MKEGITTEAFTYLDYIKYENFQQLENSERIWDDTYIESSLEAKLSNYFLKQV